MDANTVYTVAKALPEREYMQLFDLMKKDLMKPNKGRVSKVQAPVLTDKEAMIYLLEKVFNIK